MPKTLPSNLTRVYKHEHMLTTRKRNQRKPMTYISDQQRLMMLLLITEFGLSCYLAARVLEMPYTNAKVIYRVFREEKRIVQNSRNPVGDVCFTQN